MDITRLTFCINSASAQIRTLTQVIHSVSAEVPVSACFFVELDCACVVPCEPSSAFGARKRQALTCYDAISLLCAAVLEVHTAQDSK